MSEAMQKRYEADVKLKIQKKSGKKSAIDHIDHPFRISVTNEGSVKAKAVVVVPADHVQTLFDSAALTQQYIIKPTGFQKNHVPLSYIKQNYHLNLIEHVKEFLFKFGVVNFLYDQLRLKKIAVAGEPRLKNIELELGKDAFFHFDLTLAHPIAFHDWKYFSFKAPKRKNYKDLDRQVDNFIQEESVFKEQNQSSGITLYDWVNITVTPLCDETKPLLEGLTENFWFRMNDDDIESLLRELFTGKQNGAVLVTDNKGLQDYFSDLLATNYLFKVEIKDVIPYAFFCFDLFKDYFKIKTNKDMLKKLIEIFSYRNDISQRRAMVEESLALLLAKHRFDVPKHLVLRQQNNILASIRENPDYNVYRKQADFQMRIAQLAYRQAKELVLVDQVAYHDNIQVSDEDMKGYLNLTKRNRTKEFLYFEIPDTKRDGQEIPLPTAQLKQVCLREKTVNHIIYHLTKK
jgi:FKBP-type peptidyl-prolyl cis-trans isomerase (trigger factor)